MILKANRSYYVILSGISMLMDNILVLMRVIDLFISARSYQ